MSLIPFADAGVVLAVGEPLGWNVRDEQGQLLLAKGCLVKNEAVVDGLLRRGVFVDSQEVIEVLEGAGIAEAHFPGHWSAVQARLSAALRDPAASGFPEAITECSRRLAALVDRFPDRAVFAVIRHDHSRFATYGVAHSMHTATVCALLARRMGMPDDTRSSLLSAALTMNVAMLELQGQLASKGGRLTAEQQAAVHDHPTKGAQLLRAAGVTDALWLQAVEQHHEQPSGGGYPQRVAVPSELATIVRMADVFTAKHSPRAGRSSMPAKLAAQTLFVESGRHPVAAMLIKEFGIYPPGCLVKLASGETAIVVRQRACATAPAVAAVTSPNGEPLRQPLARDTTQRETMILGTVPEQAVLAQLPLRDLFETIS